MTRYESMKGAIAHKETGYVPYAIPLTTEAYRAYGERLLRDYPNRQAQEDYKRGILTPEQAVSLSIGNHLLYIYAPWWGWYNVSEEYLHREETPDTLPDTVGYGDYEKFFNLIKHIREAYDVYPLMTVWGSHWEKVYGCRGIENFLCDMAADPEWAQSMLVLIIRKNMVMLENVLPAGDFDGVLLGSDWGTQRALIMSPAMWRRMIKAGEQQEYDLVHKYNKDVWIHSCGNIEALMGDLCEMGIQVLNPVQPECMDIAMLKREYGDKICYFGGISTQNILPYGTPEDVKRETERVIALMAKGGGYITAPSQEIQVDVPYENLRMLIDTARAAAVR
ncbi:MAG: uroporphyrinogen decarboxylase family protein [Christensenellales bacterium]